MDKLDNKLKISELVNDKPLVASMMSKLITTDQSKKQRPLNNLNYEDITNDVYNKIRNNDSITQLFPDTDLAIQIVITSILSPNDLTTTSLSYDVPDISIPPQLKSQILDVIDQYLNKEYDINNSMYDIVKEAMFTKGAYAELIIPEASLDRIINGDLNGLIQESDYRNFIFNNTESIVELSTESNNKSIKFNVIPGSKFNPNDLRTYKPKNVNNITFSESELGIEFTEDVGLLIYNDVKLNNLVTESKQRDKQQYEYTDEELLSSFFRVVETKEIKDIEFILRRDEAGRKSIGQPLVTKVPVDAIIPIYSNNNPSKHVGYFIILDENGNFLDMDKEMKKMGSDCNNFTNTDFKTMLLTKAKRNVVGFETTAPEIENMEDIYNGVIEELIKNKLRQSKYEELVDIGSNNELYQIMLTRALKSKRTKMLFVPEDLLQYYAFEYRNNGTGKSLIEKSAMLYSLAGMMLFANFKASILNAIPKTTINVQLDERDTNLASTMKKIESLYMSMTQSYLPYGSISTTDLSDWSRRANIRYKWNHPDLPQIQIDEEHSEGDRPEGNQEFLDKILQLINKSFGVTPEMVDAGKEKEFATSIVADNLLFAKRVINWQIMLEKMVTKHITKILYNDMIIREKIEKIVIGSKKEIKEYAKKLAEKLASTDSYEEERLEKIPDKDLGHFITDFFFKRIEANLARPETNSSAAIITNLDEYINKVEKICELLFANSNFISRTFKNFGESSEDLKNLVKSELIITYLLENNIFNNITDWFTLDENGKPLNPIFENHTAMTEIIMKLYNEYLDNSYANKKKYINENTKILEKYDNIEGDENGGSGSDFGGDGDSEGEDGDDGFGDDDFGDEGDDFGEEDKSDNKDENEEPKDEDEGNEEPDDTGDEELKDDNK